MTLGDLLLDLKARIGPGNIKTDNELITWLNEYYMYICDQIVQENPDYFTTSNRTDLISGQWEYSLPTNAEQIVMVNANFTGTWRRLLPLQDIGQVPVLANVASPILYTELNPVYYITDGKLGILPIPTQDVSLGLKTWFAQDTNELVNPGDIPLFKMKYHHLISLGAYANYLDLDDQHSDAERIRMRFEQRVSEMCETIADRQVDQPKSIEITQDLSLYADPDGYI